MNVASYSALVAGAFITSIVAGCGSDSGSGGPSSSQIAEVTQDCKDLCNKEVSCMPGLGIDCNQICSGIGSNPSQMTTSSGAPCDLNALHAKTQQCVSGSCADLDACSSSIGQICPSHAGSQGSGGSSSTSPTGTGGASTGSATCDVCTKAAACCQALVAQEGGSADSCGGLTAATCNGLPVSDQATYVSGCQAELEGGQTLNIAACK